MSRTRSLVTVICTCAMVVALTGATPALAADEKQRFTRDEVTVVPPAVTLIDQNGDTVDFKAALSSDRPVFVDFIFFQVDEVKVIFPEFLKVTDVIVANRVAFAKSRPFELAGANFGDIVGQFSPNGFFQIDFPQHDSSPLLNGLYRFP